MKNLLPYIFALTFVGNLLASPVSMAFDAEFDALPEAKNKISHQSSVGDYDALDVLAEDYSLILSSQNNHKNSSARITEQNSKEQINFIGIDYLSEDYSPIL